MISIILTQNEADYSQARQLIDEYVEWLSVDLAFQEFDLEMKDLYRHYGPPEGGFLLIKDENKAVGGVAVRKFEANVGELKRMYIQPAYQGLGLGRKLLAESIQLARDLGYQKLRLDTMPTMNKAIHLYEAFGFYEIPAYRYNPFPGTRYLELDL